MPRPRQLEKIPQVAWRAMDKVINENRPLEIQCSDERIAKKYEARFRELQASVFHFRHPNWRDYHALQIIRRGAHLTLRHVDQDSDLAELEAAVDGAPSETSTEAAKGDEPLRVDLPDTSSGSKAKDPSSLIEGLYNKGDK